MKLPFLLTLVLLSGCASQPPLVVRLPSPTGRTLPIKERESVRRHEQVKAYPLGRYIDPHNPHIMHEGHTIYRVEATAKWNLVPSQAEATRARPKQPVSPTSTPPPLTRDELVMELNRQRAVTKAVIQGGRTVSEKLAELNQAMSQAKEVAERNQEFQKALDETKQRLDALEKEAAGQRSSVRPQSSPNPKIEW